MDEEIIKTIFKDIHRIIYLIKNCHSKSRYDILLLELNALYFLCKELGIKDYPKIENYSVKSINLDYTKNNSIFYEQIFNDIEYHKNFAKNYKKISYEKYDNEYNFLIKNKISQKDNIQLIIEFLKKYDNRLLELFYFLINNNRVLTTDNIIEEDISLSSPAISICSFGNFKPYILFQNQNNINDSISIIHELGHCYEYIKNEYISSKIFKQKRNNCLEEVSSYYLQFLYMSYLKNNKIFESDLENSFNGYNFACISMMEDLYNSLNNFGNADNIDDELNYSYGILIAHIFLERYLKDPEKGKIEAENFLIINGQYKMIEMLEKFNLSEELTDYKKLRKYL